MSANVAVFVPHLGCRHQCSFCNQREITQQSQVPSIGQVESIIERGIETLGDRVSQSEIAFFGGSFTAIEHSQMIAYLQCASSYVKRFGFYGIRVSTRPDAIQPAVLDLLAQHGVTSIELGAQSMSDLVLQANGRGHTVQDVVDACRMIRQYGFSLGLQMMTGLYQSNDALDRETCRLCADLKPDTMRIYPTLLLRNTPLYSLYQQGKYQPQTLDEAVELCAELLDLFEARGIKVIRCGLHSVDLSQFVAGPWHPAFGEKCESRRFLNRMKLLINCSGTVFCHPSDLSKVIGQKRENIRYFENCGMAVKVKTDDLLHTGELKFLGGER